MSPRYGKLGPVAFTLLELLVVIVVVGVLIAILLPSGHSRGPARQHVCINHQRQLLLGLVMFQADHKERFPWMVSATNGGAMESMAAGDLTAGYLAITNIGVKPDAFVCPTDVMRVPAQPGQPLTRSNLSYFISIDATGKESPMTTIVTGDRHLEAGGKQVGPGICALTTNTSLAWTAELHPAKGRASGGGLGFADGHVQWARLTSLPKMVADQNMATNRIVVP